MLSVGCQTKKRICSTILLIESTNTQNESRRQGVATLEEELEEGKKLPQSLQREPVMPIP